MIKSIDCEDKLYEGSCIYKIQSPSYKIYIGKSRNFKNRVREYNKLKNSSQRRLDNSFKKYGIDNHKIEILFKCEEIDLNLWEIFFIKFFDTFGTKHGLNLQSGGQGGKLSKESIEIIRNKAKGRVFSEQHKKRISEGKKGKINYALRGVPKKRESVEKLSKVLKQKYADGSIKVWNKGIKRTEEEKTKMSLANMGRPSVRKGVKLSEETKEKIRKANLGKKQSEETKQKKREISLKNGNKPPQRIWTDEDRKRWSEMSKGEKNGNYKHGCRVKIKL